MKVLQGVEYGIYTFIVLRTKAFVYKEEIAISFIQGLYISASALEAQEVKGAKNGF